MSLTTNDGKIIVAMAARGDKHHDIAAHFGENQARVAEVLSGQMFGPLSAAPADQIPPKGAPGIKGRRLRGGVTKAIEQLEGGDGKSALATLKEALVRYNRNE